jgi:hypothetical protein
MICHRHRLPRRLLLEATIWLGVIAATGLVDTGSVAEAARRAPWCAYMGASSGDFDCSYHTFEQCMETARGLGGYCSPNPAAGNDGYRKPRRVRR